MVLRSWCKLVNGRFGYVKKTSQKTEPINEVCCDSCGKIFEERVKDTIKNENKLGKQLCGACRKKENGKNFGKIGGEILKNFSKEEKSRMCSEAGKISHQKSPNNKGKFSTDRWNNMSTLQQKEQVSKANKALHDKLNNDENLKREHFLKVFKNSRIGFTSKGHNELHLFLTDFGFKQHEQISSMEVDECNLELKIVIEFNGDMYHCNPRKWKPTDYNKVIKMTASEKWEKDRNRYYILKSLGYITFVVWEDDWALKREEVKEKIVKFINKRKDEIKKN
jgi:very-short-patch-repair endonuclease